MKKAYIGFAIIIIAFAFAACDGVEEKQDITTQAITGEVTDLASKSAVIHGSANLPKSTASDIELGILLSTSEGLLPSTSTKLKATVADGNYNFSVLAEDLSPYTTYYYRAYVTQASTNDYGETKSFTTPYGISFNNSSISLEEGSTTTLVAVITPSTATGIKIKWTSNDDNIAVVEDGVVTGENPGVAVITAEIEGGEIATCLITVYEKPLGEARISVNPTSISFAAGDDTQSVTLVATRDWHIDSQPDWVALDKTSGSASTKDQTVTVSVDANKLNDREGEIIFTIGLAKASLAVKQAGEAGELKKGSGTLEDPFSVAGVIEYCQNLGADVQSTDKVYVKGKIESVATTFEASGSYGNATFYIIDNDGDTDKFYVYQTYYLGNRQWKSGDTDVKAGDVVVVYGPVVNYKGNTPETVGKGASYIYSLNGEAGKEDDTDYSKCESKTIAEFIRIADKSTYYKLTGKVSKFNSQYCSMDITDESGSIYVYSVDNKSDWSSKISDGGTVVLAGLYDYYAAKEQHEVVNAHILSFTAGEGGGEDDTLNPKGSGTLEDPYNVDGILSYVKKLPAGETSSEQFYVKGKVSTVTQTYTYNVTNGKTYGNARFNISDSGDAKNEFICYNCYYFNNEKFVEGQTDIKVGDEVIVVGNVVNYNGNTPEFASGKSYLYSLNGATSSETSDTFGVEKAEISVGASATEATVNVTGNVAWTATSSDAKIEPASGNGAGAIKVTFEANTDTEKAKTYTVVVSTTADVSTKSYTVTITQSKASAATGGTTYVLDGEAIKAAHDAAWSYTSGEKKVTATDNSEWVLFNTYANKNQVTVQMNKGKSAYVLTPALPEGMEVKKISVVLNTKNDGSGNMGDRPMDILSADGSKTLLDNVTGQNLADGLDVATGNSQVRIICDETNGGAVYITSITVTYGAK